MKKVDKNYCMSSFLSFRYIVDSQKIFREGVEHHHFSHLPDEEKMECSTVDELDENITACISRHNISRAALLLSGGMDSGIIASYMPKGTKAYTVRNASKLSEIDIERAKKICEINELEHIVVDVNWSDYDKIMDTLSIHDGCPVFSNEPQLYYLAKKALNDGHDTVIDGEGADITFGGMDGLLSKDWKFDEFIQRFTFLDPKKVLVHPIDMTEVYEPFRKGIDEIDTIRFLKEIYAFSSGVAFHNAFDFLKIEQFSPFKYQKMKYPLDLKRIRNGESKYIIRNLYHKKYPYFDIPEKIAMPRSMDQYMRNWKGPSRQEFLTHCHKELTGEQKFLVYSLERFLDIIEGDGRT